MNTLIFRVSLNVNENFYNKVFKPTHIDGTSTFKNLINYVFEQIKSHK